ncbi:replication initiation protein [Aliivibrio salmonicida]|uniref:replication initiation protein n=1 Tax=Aliivibrio salmonicida TaxID=40269 RepID=UPI003D09C659
MSRKIYTRNDARPALIGMGLGARRLMFICLAQLERESSKDNVVIKFDSSQSFLIRVCDYAELCSIDYSAAYRQVVEGMKELRGYVLEADQGLLKKRDNSIPEDAIEPFTIAERGTWYSKGDGSVNIKFAKEMEPLISNLKGNFTGQFLLSAMHLPDGNAGKLYLILREWISSGFIVDKTLDVSEFKESLGLSTHKNYESYPFFKQSFFDRAIKKLIEKTEFTDIKMEIVERRARKAYRVKVSYHYDEKSINKRDKVVDNVLNKTEINQEKKKVLKENKGSLQEDTLFFIFANRYLDRNGAKALNLDWELGLTAQEVLDKLSK